MSSAVSRFVFSLTGIEIVTFVSLISWTALALIFLVVLVRGIRS
jgi:hypothetical protein